MLRSILALAIAAAPAGDSAGPRVDTVPAPAFVIPMTPMPDSTRMRAIEHSDAYYTRLTIHRYGSYAMLPLFGAEYFLGQRLMNTSAPRPGWLRPTHIGVAMGLGALFTSNTVTGAWNLWDGRHDSDGRALRYLHTALMLTADAGFALAPAFADDDNGFNRSLHKNVALASIGVATLGSAIMWLRKN